MPATTSRATRSSVVSAPPGADGAAAVGVTDDDGPEAGPVPALLVAFTVNVYLVPLVRPETTQVVPPVVVQCFAPGEDVTVYPLIVAPPLAAGAVQNTDAEASPAVAWTPLGAPGRP